MFKTFRMVVEKTSSGTEEDIVDKKKLKDLETAVTTLQRTQQYYLKSFADFNANAAAFHVDIANVYPAGETLSSAVMQLNASGGVFKDAAPMAEQIKEAFARPVADILARIKDLTAKADERQVIRAEISHYREKVTRLANDGLSNVKAQSKAESNQEKLMRNQQRFRELDAELGEALKGLDHLVAEVTNASLARFVQLQATYASGLLHAYGNALAAIPGSLKAGGPPAAVVMPSPGPAPAAAASPAAPAAAGAGGAGASPATASHGRGSVSGGIASGSLASFTSASPAPAAAGGAAGAGGFITDPKALFADVPDTSAPPAASAAAPAASHSDHGKFAGDSGSGGASMASFLGGGGAAAAAAPPVLSVESLHASTTSAGGDPAAVPASSAAAGNPFASPSAGGPAGAERVEKPHVVASSNPFADSDDFAGPPPAPAE